MRPKFTNARLDNKNMCIECTCCSNDGGNLPIMMNFDFLEIIMKTRVSVFFSGYSSFLH